MIYGIGFKVEGNLELNDINRTYAVDGQKVVLLPVPDVENKAIVLVEMEAARGVDAFRLAHDYADKLLDSISFTMDISLYIPGMSIVLKAQPGSTRREALTISYRPLDRALWLNETNDTKIRAMLAANTSLTLSLRWLRLGYRARSSIEQFTNFWLALETYVGPHTITTKCPNCNGDVSTYDTTDMPKIKEHLRQYNVGLTAADVSKIISLRHKLFHGGAGFTLATSAEASKWRTVVRHTVLELLKASSGIELLDLDEPNTPHEATRIFTHIAFDTTTPNETIALDFPTEQQILEGSTSYLDDAVFEVLDMTNETVNNF